MKIKYLSIIFLFFILNNITAQGNAYALKGGLTIANQRFNGGSTYNNGLMFKYHAALYVENAPDDPTSVLFAQIGYHTRGHARRFPRGMSINPSNNQLIEVPSFKEQFVFNNAALIIGVKKRNVLDNEHAYYAVGVRGEYTVNNNLPSVNANLPIIYQLYYPQKEFVKKINYGLTLTGGYEFPFSELVGGFAEFTVHPDVSRQYYQPPIQANIRDPFTGETIGIIPEQSIRNLTFELTIGIRFLHKVVYVN